MHAREERRIAVVFPSGSRRMLKNHNCNVCQREVVSHRENTVPRIGRFKLRYCGQRASDAGNERSRWKPTIRCEGYVQWELTRRSNESGVRRKHLDCSRMCFDGRDNRTRERDQERQRNRL
jgi:hypothetical protein